MSTPAPTSSVESSNDTARTPDDDASNEMAAPGLGIVIPLKARLMASPGPSSPSSVPGRRKSSLLSLGMDSDEELSVLEGELAMLNGKIEELNALQRSRAADGRKRFEEIKARFLRMRAGNIKKEGNALPGMVVDERGG